MIHVLLSIALLSPLSWAKADAGLKKLDKSLRSPASRLSSALKGKVCVLDFNDLSDLSRTSELGQKVADLLVVQLVNRAKGRYTVVERRELIKILQDSAGITDTEQAAYESLRKHAGMDVLVSGTYSVAGKEVSIDVKAVDAKTGAVLASATARLQKTGALDKMLSRSRPAGEEKDEASPDAPSLEAEVGVFYEGADGKLYPLREGMVLGSSDNYALYVKTKQPCHLYIYQVDSSQKAFQIFPNEKFSAAKNPLKEREELWIPGGGEFFYLDEIPGREELYVFATHGPAPQLEGLTEAKPSELQAAIRTMGLAGKRGSQAASAARRRATDVEAMELVVRKLASRGDFYHRISFVHQ